MFCFRSLTWLEDQNTRTGTSTSMTSLPRTWCLRSQVLAHAEVALGSMTCMANSQDVMTVSKIVTLDTDYWLQVLSEVGMALKEIL